MTPLFVGFLIFTVITFAVAILYSLVDYMPLAGTVSPISLQVFVSLFRGEYVMVGFGKAIVNTLIIMLSIPLNLIIGLLFSALITQKWFKGGAVLRVILYLPAVTGAVAITLVWKLMFNETQGIVNVALKGLGLIDENINWLGITSGEFFPRFVLILKNVWGGIGGVVILYVAGILNISESYYEAAEIDGSTFLQKVRYVVWPLVRPTTVFLTVTSVINGFQSFQTAYLMTGGGPDNATTMAGLLIFNRAFKYFEYGEACAQALLLAMIIAVFAIFQFKLNANDVEY